jgi:hypothetical protein
MVARIFWPNRALNIFSFRLPRFSLGIARPQVSTSPDYRDVEGLGEGPQLPKRSLDLFDGVCGQQRDQNFS